MTCDPREMRKIRVVHITTGSMPLRFLLLDQLKALQQEGYDVMTISAPGEYVDELRAYGISHIAVPMTRRPLTPIRDLWALWRLYRVLRDLKPTIVHTHNPKTGLLGQLGARLAGVPIVINTIHGLYVNDQMSRTSRTFFLLIEKVAARCSDAILSQNKEDISTLVEERICDDSKIGYLGEGIDLKRFDPDVVSRAQIDRLRSELSLPPEAPVVGFVGRLVREKGVLDLVAAARLVRDKLPEVRFLIIGPADKEKDDDVSQQLMKLPPDEPIQVLGLREDIPELLMLMDVFVLPSYREGLPRVVMEASAMGVPSVVTDVRGCRQVVRHDENGLLTPAGDPQALANALLDVLCDPDKASRYARRGRAMAQDQFNEITVLEKVKAEYARLLAEKLDSRTRQ